MRSRSKHSQEARRTTPGSTFSGPSVARRSRDRKGVCGDCRWQWRGTLDLSVEDAQSNVMCWHRVTKICWQRLAGHCAALLLLCRCRRTSEACQSKSPRVMNPQACLAFLSSFLRTESCSANLAAPIAKLLLTVACSRERLRKKVGQLRGDATIKDLTVTNYCIWKHPNCLIEFDNNKLLHPENEQLSTTASRNAIQLLNAIAIPHP